MRSLPYLDRDALKLLKRSLLLRATDNRLLATDDVDTLRKLVNWGRKTNTLERVYRIIRAVGTQDEIRS